MVTFKIIMKLKILTVSINNFLKYTYGKYTAIFYALETSNKFLLNFIKFCILQIHQNAQNAVSH